LPEPSPTQVVLLQITETLSKFFTENPNEIVYCGEFDVDGNSKVSDRDVHVVVNFQTHQ
jgi:hypothetical protein